MGPVSPERLYRKSFDEQLFLITYGRIYAKGRAMASEVDGQTPEGMSLDTVRENIGLSRAYYEPRFSARSHGFRPGRGCHTALDEIASTWTGTTWFIEGDIADCFGSLDHENMITILAERIHDGRPLALVQDILRAGYMQSWT